MQPNHPVVLQQLTDERTAELRRAGARSVRTSERREWRRFARWLRTGPAPLRVPAG